MCILIICAIYCQVNAAVWYVIYIRFVLYFRSTCYCDSAYQDKLPPDMSSALCLSRNENTTLKEIILKLETDRENLQTTLLRYCNADLKQSFSEEIYKLKERIQKLEHMNNYVTFLAPRKWISESAFIFFLYPLQCLRQLIVCLLKQFYLSYKLSQFLALHEKVDLGTIVKVLQTY